MMMLPCRCGAGEKFIPLLSCTIHPSKAGDQKKNESLNIAESVLEHLRPQLNKMCNEGSGSSSLATSNSLNSKVCDGGDSQS